MSECEHGREVGGCRQCGDWLDSMRADVDDAGDPDDDRYPFWAEPDPAEKRILQLQHERDAYRRLLVALTGDDPAAWIEPSYDYYLYAASTDDHPAVVSGAALLAVVAPDVDRSPPQGRMCSMRGCCKA